LGDEPIPQCDSALAGGVPVVLGDPNRQANRTEAQ
jgi:hypothetical protein